MGKVAKKAIRSILWCVFLKQRFFWKNLNWQRYDNAMFLELAQFLKVWKSNLNQFFAKVQMAEWLDNPKAEVLQDHAKRPWGWESKCPLELALSLKRTFILSEFKFDFLLSSCLPSWIAPQLRQASLFWECDWRQFLFSQLSQVCVFKDSPFSETNPTQQWTNGLLFIVGKPEFEIGSTDANATPGFIGHMNRVQLSSLFRLEATWLDWRVWILFNRHFYNFSDAQAKIYFAQLSLVFSNAKKKFWVFHHCGH